MNEKTVSISVIRRLPRYYRYLGMLLHSGVTRISSKELAAQMKVTASQIRQDLNCFGGFGQQGYGYNVELLYKEIGAILGVEKKIPAILIGCGTRGQSLIREDDLFRDRGFELIGAFDKSPEKIGQVLPNGLTVQDIATLPEFCRQRGPHMAVVCIPRDAAEQMAETLVESGIRSFWNFSSYDFKLKYEEYPSVNVHLGDSLLTLSYLVNHPKGLNIGMRHISLSTCGLVDKIELLAERNLQLTLSVSLHSPDNESRNKIMPVNKRWPVEQLLAACRAYFEKTGRRVSFEYTMIDGVSDAPEQAELLAKKLHGMQAHVNMIPLNNVEESGLKCSSHAAIEQFQKILESHGVTATVRRTLGSDIDASCGQLRRKFERKGD